MLSVSKKFLRSNTKTTHQTMPGLSLILSRLEDRYASTCCKVCNLCSRSAHGELTVTCHYNAGKSNQKMLGSSLADKSALVLELGARFARCGVSGERSPRCVEPWQMGNMLQKPRSATEWHQFLYPMLNKVCFELLLVNPTRRHFVVCEDLLLPRVFRTTLLDILYNMLKASAVTLVPSMLAVLYATANHTALVVDCGWSETRVLPVYKGIPLPHLYETVSIGSRDCCEIIQRELNNLQDQPMESSQMIISVTGAIAEDILERACFAQQIDPLQNIVDAKFQMQDSAVLQVPGNLRTDAVEPLLLGGEKSEGNSIVDGIVNVLKRTPIDVRAAMLENLLLVGGTAMIPGLLHRVLAEVCEALRQDNEFASASATIDRTQLVPTYFPRNMLAWVGGSIYAATESARMAAITSQEYSSSKGTCIPDWLTVAEDEF
ncbi:Actin and related proteins [Plasmopara halstedii]|uniref:Actin and related proteins n=1 Tax=Plasmopara halstedii TaxID=4781 RepID=A0A0P1AQ99_PLAHL|nr:Actin and related proteins [Plasmopara halstedii]CEG43060.1 Actin and related proteins [Plasmopara halstedii]|eukprot:XP_024579429.1 Actin and related proteins [Plasmopara halstedii]